jgi:hypothetical protein
MSRAIATLVLALMMVLAGTRDQWFAMSGNENESEGD